MNTISTRNRIPAGRAVLAVGLFTLLAEMVQAQESTGVDPAVDILLRIEGFEGDVAEKDRAGWIAVDSFNYGLSRPVGADEAARHKGLTLVKSVDRASPFLYLHCSSGQPLDEVVVETTRTAGDDVSIQEFRLRKVTVTSVQTSAASNAKRATERVTLHYESITWTYVKLDPVTGNVISELTMQWNLREEDG
jgi:type VI secretion system secreted protein Hcp